MTTSFASNYDLKSIIAGVVGRGMVRVSRSMLAVSIAAIGSSLGDPMVGTTFTKGISLLLLKSTPSIASLGWVSSSLLLVFLLEIFNCPLEKIEHSLQ
jgi:hypothetical protein